MISTSIKNLSITSINNSSNNKAIDEVFTHSYQSETDNSSNSTSIKNISIQSINYNSNNNGINETFNDRNKINSNQSIDNDEFFVFMI